MSCVWMLDIKRLDSLCQRCSVGGHFSMFKGIDFDDRTCELVSVHVWCVRLHCTVRVSEGCAGNVSYWTILKWLIINNMERSTSLIGEYEADMGAIRMYAVL